MLVKKIVHTLCGAVLLGVLSTSATGAMMDDRHTTYFTFSRTVQLPGVVLPPGTYIFEVLNPNGGSDVVRVMSRDRKRLFLLRLTRFAYRSQHGNLDSTVTLGESATGNPPTVKAWYPHSETRGREFIY
jgi:hypothetical protein